MNKKSTIPYKQLEQENKVLGNIISSLKSSKTQIETQNKKLQDKIHSISNHQQKIQTENDELRNITAELQKKLHSYIQPPQLQEIDQINLSNQQNKEINNSPQQQNKDIDDNAKSELLLFLQNISDRINNIESNISQKQHHQQQQHKQIMNKSKVNFENDLHCFQQEIHRLEMEKLDLLKNNQQCIIQLQDLVKDHQSFRQKLCHLENENMRLRQHMIEKNASFSNLMSTRYQNDENNKKLNVSDLTSIENIANEHSFLSPQNPSILTFENLIKQVVDMENASKEQENLKKHIFTLSDELQKLREKLIEKESENESLLDKYNTILQQYNIICSKYI